MILTHNIPTDIYTSYHYHIYPRTRLLHPCMVLCQYLLCARIHAPTLSYTSAGCRRRPQSPVFTLDSCSSWTSCPKSDLVFENPSKNMLHHLPYLILYLFISSIYWPATAKETWSPAVEGPRCAKVSTAETYPLVMKFPTLVFLWKIKSFHCQLQIPLVDVLDDLQGFKMGSSLFSAILCSFNGHA
jgi:hypothetical protein